MNMKKVLSVLLALVIILGTIPGMSFAVSAGDEPATETTTEPAAETVTITNDTNSGTMTVALTVPERDPVPYIDADGNQNQTGPDCYDVYQTDTSLGISGMERWYKVSKNMTLDTEDSLKILGDLRLILCDGVTFTVPHGINLDGGSITIYAQSNDPQTMGKLIANAHDNNCAAIGSSGANNPGSITIIGGDITATGSTNGAAIGGGAGKTNVNVNIKGGVVHANGTGSGVAIRGNITVNSGTVTAIGGTNGAAIMGGTITVNGGDITATSGDNSHAIGGYIIVGGGNITATGGANAAAIGGVLIVNDGTINVTGGINAAAIGCDLTVNGGSVTATGGENATAISGNLTVNGGSVTATGVPALAGSTTLIRNALAKAGDSESTAVDIDQGKLEGKKYVHIYLVPEYTVTWKDYDGTVLDTTIVLEGSIPKTDIVPSRSSTAQYHFTFSGWSPKVVAATGDITYTATYSETVREYTITFWDEGEDNLIQRSKCAYGTTPTCNETPFKIGDDENVYTFSGWSPKVTSVTGDANYYATFTASTRPILGLYKISATFTNGSNSSTKTVSSSTALPYTTSSAALRTLANCQDKTGGKVTVVTAGDNIGSISNTSSFIINKTGTEKIRIYNSQNNGYIDCTLTVTKVGPLAPGQYIRMGTYKGVPIDWYCVKNNATGCFMISKYALKTNRFGANATYKTSDVHAWLDIDSGGTFAKDIGLTPEELSIVRTVNLSSSGGDGTDSFIIPAYGNDELQSGQKIQAPYAIGTNTLVDQYWLRTARDSANARIVNHSKDGMPVATVSARYSGVGNGRWIRPMFYLATDAFNGSSFSGTGTEANPFMLEPKYKLKGTSSTGGTYTIKVTHDGTEIYNGNCPVYIPEGAQVLIETKPAAGYYTDKYDSFYISDDTGWCFDFRDTFTMRSHNVNIYVEFKKQKYDVNWKNYNGTVIKTDNVEYGTTLKYDGETPVREETEACTYAFQGWTPTIAAVTANTTYTAQYTATPNPEHFSIDGNTYTIHDSIGWEAFCECLLDNATYNEFSGKTVVLDADISVSRMAGTGGHEFKGTFDGKGHTITVSYGTESSPYASNGAGPFLIVNTGCYIKNLHTAGTIYTKSKFAAGIIGIQNGTVIIENCRSSVTINSTLSGDATHGGLVGTNQNNSPLTIKGCVFDGKMLGGATKNCGGIVGWRHSTVNISDTIFAPAEITIAVDGNCATFARNNPTSVTNSYYMMDFGAAQGKKAYSVTENNVTINLGESTVYDVSGITAYGTGIEYNGTFYAGEGDKITLSNTAPVGYTFKQYTVNAGTVEGNTLTMPAENVIVNVEFVKAYTVIWKNGEDVLETDENVPENTVPTYDGETPVKADDACFTYTFSGWSPEVTAVTGDVTYTAVFERVAALKFAGTSLTLNDNIQLNLMVEKDLVLVSGCENPYAVFVVDGNEITVSEYTVNDKYYIFTLDNIQQDQLKSEVTATLYATYNDTLVSGNSKTATVFDFGTQGCDINGDGSVDIRDLISLKKLMCNAPVSEESDDVVDLDFSGTLDALDLTYLVKMLLLV